jgi:hypothetical protein
VARIFTRDELPKVAGDGDTSAMAFTESLKRHLRGEPPRLRELPGFEHEGDDLPHVPLYLAARLFATVAEWRRDSHVDQAGPLPKLGSRTRASPADFRPERERTDSARRRIL